MTTPNEQPAPVVVEEVLPEEVPKEVLQEKEVPAPEHEWKPVTELGKKVQAGVITDIAEIFASGQRILEPEIVDALLPNLEEELLLIGQAKGKFGGGQRRIFRQTQKKTQEGNKPHFTVCAVVGNRNGYVGVGFGKSKETVPSRDKARLKARLNIIQIRRGSGSWESASKEPRSIPFAVEGKCGSVRMLLFPAPKGKGLCIEKECAKVLELAGIKDIWSKSRGQTRTKINSVMALMDALRKLSEVKIRPEDVAAFGLAEGKLKQTEEGIEDTDRVMPEEQTAAGASTLPA
ncbi:MAG TPA: 30S ribosomal protein S5 [Candidatus Nanoarchaeia archaeon]|nr:30S ribosomal protein S5 [Candidatus Nanoarchaeia archaeon]